MLAINRIAIVVRPAQRFLEWLHQADPSSAGLTLKDLQTDPTVYLLRERENPQDLRDELAKVCKDIFEEELDGWWRETSSWPQRRGISEFEQWFEWTSHVVVLDLCKGAIQREHS
jgi:hypothetical protein